MPTRSLKSLASCNLAGRWCFRPTDSTQASHTNSLAAATIWGEAFWAFKCSANTFGSGWPKLVWSFFKSDLSWGSKSRNLGPWMEIGGGAHPSNWAGGWNPEALTIASSLGTGLGITPWLLEHVWASLQVALRSLPHEPWVLLPMCQNW